MKHDQSNLNIENKRSVSEDWKFFMTQTLTRREDQVSNGSYNVYNIDDKFCYG